METQVRRSRAQRLALERVENGWEVEFQVFVGDYLPDYDPAEYHNGVNWRKRRYVFSGDDAEANALHFLGNYLELDPAALAGQTEGPPPEPTS